MTNDPSDYEVGDISSNSETRAAVASLYNSDETEEEKVPDAIMTKNSD